jgi:hypothetical protein
VGPADVQPYNPNTDYFQNLRVLFEFNPSGIMAHTSTVSVQQPEFVSHEDMRPLTSRLNPQSYLFSSNLPPPPPFLSLSFNEFINVGLQAFVLALLL